MGRKLIKNKLDGIRIKKMKSKIKKYFFFSILPMIFCVLPSTNSYADTYKVGDNCKDIQEIDYPEGLWCSIDRKGNLYFSEIPYQIDNSQKEILIEEIEGLDCTKVKTREDCEKLARFKATETIVNKFNLTKEQAETILSCYQLKYYTPPDFEDLRIYIDDDRWYTDTPRLCFWYKFPTEYPKESAAEYPKASAAERFNNLDGGAKFSIIFFVLFAVFLFIIFFDAFSPKTKESGIGGLSARTAKTILAMAGVALGIVFLVWLYVALIEPLFSGSKIDLSKKIFGVPQYMLSFMYGMYFLIWNSNRKK
jgi:hypothetical protein